MTCAGMLARSGGGNTYRLFGLLHAGLNLLKGILDFVIDEIYLVLTDYGDGGLGGELFRARPPHSPVPSHANFGRGKGQPPWARGGKIGIRR